jgi:hypothetical protein
MNILIFVAIAAASVSLLWAVQSAALAIAGEPLAWPLRFKTRYPLVRWSARLMIQVCWITILVVTPLALGIAPVDALHQAFPMPVPWRSMVVAFSLFFFPALFIYALWIKAGWVRVEPQHDPVRRRGKLFRRFLTPVPLATMEEWVFRGILLEQLLQAFPQSIAATTLAIILSSAAFSSVHFIKPPYPGAPVWQAAYGYFLMGCLFGVAYVVGGRSLWLPITMHATAILVVQVFLLYTVHQGPAWLVGYSEWPQSGLMGSLFILSAGIALVAMIGH